jgi:hypothetical protein
VPTLKQNITIGWPHIRYAKMLKRIIQRHEMNIIEIKQVCIGIIKGLLGD